VQFDLVPDLRLKAYPMFADTQDYVCTPRLAMDPQPRGVARANPFALDDPQVVRLLVIDDSEGDYVITRKLLLDAEDTNYQVDWASHGSTALQIMEDEEHDVYLLDQRLGALSGLDVLTELRARGMTRPTIMLSGLSDASPDRQAMNAGASDYIVKGEMTAAVLERSIRYALEQHLKIDRSFVKDSALGGANARLVKGTLALAEAMGITTVAEGVETELQRNFLLANHCVIMQG
jgi:DNA-binding response OmpR family regulator